MNQSSSLFLELSAAARLTASSFVNFPVMMNSPMSISVCMMGAAASSPFTTKHGHRARDKNYYTLSIHRSKFLSLRLLRSLRLTLIGNWYWHWQHFHIGNILFDSSTGRWTCNAEA